METIDSKLDRLLKEHTPVEAPAFLISPSPLLAIPSNVLGIPISFSSQLPAKTGVFRTFDENLVYEGISVSETPLKRQRLETPFISDSPLLTPLNKVPTNKFDSLFFLKPSQVKQLLLAELKVKQV